LRGKLLDFGGLGGPGRPGNPSEKMGGAKPPIFSEGFPAARGRADTKNPTSSLSICSPLLVPPPCADTCIRLTGFTKQHLRRVVGGKGRTDQKLWISDPPAPKTDRETLLLSLRLARKWICYEIKNPAGKLTQN